MTVKDTLPGCAACWQGPGRRLRGRPSPASLMPLDGQVVNEERPDLRWEIPGEGSLLAHVCEQRYGPGDEEDTSWPEVRLAVFPAEPRSGKVNVFSGIIGKGMSWGVWTIGRDGRVAVSPPAHFTVEFPSVDADARQ